MTPKLVDTDQRKREIIEATIFVLSEKGIKDIRITDIAKKLDLGKSTIYEYFKNKDDLLKQSFEFFLQELYIPEANEKYSFLEELNYILDRYLKHTDQELKQFNVIIDIFFASIKGDFKEFDFVFNDYINYMVEKIKKDQQAGLIRKEVNPQAAVSWIGATLDGLGIQLIMRDEFNGEEIFSSFLEAVEVYLKNK
ncbi:TetR/AcrR family transcriptional regulator [Halanaerobium sp. ST460_2HS_T2]|uniref:TetR/AcrR family transcriptional regulator n=1 Tax=Halanaerobium sp. ST460_2HS_T2 TaxID=2183914 RepID=UPI000DF1B9FF|nr:TetR/AcrR family transcriptional regulator [Halanaerobium sp. ST460_2HS_T2]RCW57387.1 TetR family transcriptional regulator [Halanaerobium sp. ST460_2HS_T2]